ncbi:hypothetical protein X874_10600 [Mannheimia varigena USDA-ARS-USMARC-1312]|nr:hypothetical protein X874_10600 [Mannheimia varigena USDA-ARS-USMARC-1312]
MKNGIEIPFYLSFVNEYLKNLARGMKTSGYFFVKFCKNLTA